MDIPMLEIGVLKNCRVCLKRNLEMLEIFGNNDYDKMLRECGKVDVKENDGLPLVICKPCTKEMIQANEFLVKCQDSDRKLRHYLNVESNDLKLIKTENESNIVTGYVKYENLDDSDGNFEQDVDYTDSVKPEVDFGQDKQRKEKNTTSKRYKIVKENPKKLKDNDFPQKCSECNFVAKYKSVLEIHMATHKPFLCNICGKHLKSLDGMKGHFLRTHAQDKKDIPFKCDMCDKRFFRKKDLTVHYRIHTGETPHACKYCPKSFTQISSLVRHTRIHTGDRPYKCGECGKCFAGKNSLSRHSETHISERIFSCTMCGALFKTKANLNQHLLTHSAVKDIVCDQCGMCFAKKSYLSLHVKRVHSEKSGYCSYCKKEVSNLSEHFIIHTGEKPFKCDLCQKSFNRKCFLSSHLTKHYNNKKFTCKEENCSKAFPRSSMLAFHELKFHKKQSPFSCVLCNKSLFRMCDLKKHMRVYHPEKRSSDLINVEIKN